MKKIYLFTLLSFLVFGALAQNTEKPLFSDQDQEFLNINASSNQLLKTNSNKHSVNRSANNPTVGDVKLYGGNGENVVLKVLNDEQGNIYSFGYYHKALTIEAQSITSDSITTYFMAKYNASGEIISLQNILTFTSDITFAMDDVKAFKDGFLLIGRANKDLLINDVLYGIPETKGFLLKLNLDGSTDWFKDYTVNRLTAGTRNTIPMDVSPDSIYVSFDKQAISILNENGDSIKSYQINISDGGEIEQVAINGSSIVVTGTYFGTITAGTSSVTSTNNSISTFIFSIEKDTKNVEWIKGNSTERDIPFSASFPILMETDNGNNIYLYGNYTGGIAWDGVEADGYYRNTYISKFNKEGILDSTFVFNNDASVYSMEVFEDKLLIKNEKSTEINKSQDISGANLIVIDTSMTLLSVVNIFPERDFNLLIENLNVANNGKLYLTGSYDNQAYLAELNTIDYTAQYESKSNDNSGFYEITGFKQHRNGDYIIAGNKSGNIAFGDQFLNDTSTAIIGKFDLSNSMNWLLSLYNVEIPFEYGNSLILNADKIAFLGKADDNSAINNTPISINGNFVTQLNLDGSIDWTKELSGVELHSAAYDNDGNIYISGNMETDFSIQGNQFPSTGGVDFFVLKLSPTGGLIWFRNYGSVDSNFAYGASLVISRDNIYLTGEYAFNGPTTITVEETTIDIGGATYGNNILISFTSDGSLNWMKSHGASSAAKQDYYWGTGMTASDNGGFYMAGIFGESNNFDDVTLTSDYTYNQFIAKYDSLGSISWVRPIYTPSLGFNYGEIDTDSEDNVYIQGGFSQTINFDSIATLSPNGGPSIYVAKFMADGTFDWTEGLNTNINQSRVISVIGVDQLTVGANLRGRYNIGNQTAQAYFGNSFIASFCQSPSSIATPVGEESVTQTDLTSYTATLNGANEVEWTLSPTQAGTISIIENDSITISWSDTFEGTAELQVQESNLCGSATSEPLMITVEKLCNALSQPSQPTGEATVTQTENNTYTSVLSDYDSTSWVLEPATAGALTKLADNEVSVTWDAEFLGEATIVVTAYNNCEESLASEALAITVELLCNTLTQPTVPSGPAEVTQNEQANYTTNLVAYDSVAWTLSPTNAGQIELIQDDSISVNWNEAFLGEVLIQVTAYNNCKEAKASTVLTVSVLAPEVTANANQLADQFQIYPNPTSTLLNIKVMDDVKIDRMTIVNINGQEMLSDSKTNNSAIDVSQLETGIYYLEIYTSEGKVTSRFVKN